MVSYDIVEDKRRNKVMKIVEGYGRRVQYSVFECELRPADLDTLKARLSKVIDEKQDDVRFYQLCESCLQKVAILGKGVLHRHLGHVIVEN